MNTDTPTDTALTPEQPDKYPWMINREDMPPREETPESWHTMKLPPPEEEPPTTMKLGDEFDAALLGATITGQYAYSLTRLSMIVMQDMHVHPEVAQKMVAEQVVAVMREHGAESPVFVDDSLMFGADIAVEEEPQPIFVTNEMKEPQPIFTGETPTLPIFTGETPTLPIFVADELKEPQPIYTGEKTDNVILIPGVTHGACKGFLDPNGIKS